MLPEITCKQQIEDLIEEYGFLPFWSNKAVPGFSIIDHIDSKLWDLDYGIWEWKNDIVTSGNYLYGKIYNNKAGFVSKKWISDFVNYRRDGYDFDSLVECGLALNEAIVVYEKIEEYRSISTKVLRQQCNLPRKYESGEYNRILDFLMMRGYVCTCAIEKQISKDGKPYGIGMARYSTVDFQFGKKLTRKAYKRDPEESLERMIEHLLKVYPEASYQQFKKMLKY